MKTRKSLAKKIAAEPDLIKKRDIAFGQSIQFNYHSLPKSELDTFAFLRQTRFLAGLFSEKNRDKRDSKMTVAAMSSIGAVIVTLINNNDHKFFSRLAAMMQFGRMPDSPHKLYCDILRYCYGNGFDEPTGTEKNPCDGMKLTVYLKAQGHRFSGYENQVPRTLRAICKKIHVILARQR